MKTEQIQVPDGYELKQVSAGKWELAKEEVTLDDILVKSSQYKKSYICTSSDTFLMSYKDDSLLERLEALSKLMCVADYLNDGWQPDWDWNSREDKYFIMQNRVGTIGVDFTRENCGQVYFKSGELARKAIEICGLDIIKEALMV